MPSILTEYENVDFIASRPFTYNGTKYELGDDVPDAKGFGNLESLIRSRFLVPVVSETAHKPFQFHREVKTKDLALRKMGIDPDAPKEPEEEVVPEPEGEFDPGSYTINEVMAYVDAHPDQTQDIYDREHEGKGRSTLLNKLNDRLQEESNV